MNHPTWKKIFCKDALLPIGWTKDVLIEIDLTGTIISIAPNSKKRNAQMYFDMVIPGMPNVHSHVHQIALAGRTERARNSNENFWGWRDMMYQFLKNITPSDLKVFAEYAFLEMLKSGYTSVAEFHYLHHDFYGKPYSNPAEMSLAIIKAANNLGIGLTILPVLYQYSNFGGRTATETQRRFVNNSDGFLRIIDEIIAQQKNYTALTIGIAPHSLRAVGAKHLKQVLHSLEGKNLPTHIHIAEQKKEVEDCISYYGQSPIEWLFDKFEVDQSWCLIHATHINKPEIQIISQSNAIVGICPITEANLGDGIFKSFEFSKVNGKFGIGSDSNITINPFDELRILEYGQRLKLKKRNLLSGSSYMSTGRNLYEMAAQNGGIAIGRNVGKIAINYKADLIVINTNIPSLIAKRQDTVLDSLVFSENKNAITDVFVNGVHVIKNGFHRDQNRIIQSYKMVMTKLLNS